KKVPYYDRFTRGDLSSYYTNTWLSFMTPDDDGWWPGYIEDVRGTDTNPYFVVMKENGDRYNIPVYAEDNNDISFKWPELGMIYHKKSAMYVKRESQRQWKKGVRPQQLKIYPLYNNHDMRHMVSSRTSVFSQIFWDIFNPKYYTLNAALCEISKKDAKGVPLSKEFAVSRR
ncbi:MAG: hypothetical protein GWN01_01665, partial [Nitrosopumilaceae archaeon]|nr:hypothetical protein [Nitrosopumilaceae archaeon]NIU86069.1 hypothetical protein [Nitrosopumilaceae archaeon]NIV64822.1 hypothetical protein [Nitrosopumilaceae archaeon]NIX60285.1 hypothetical protein [Nitrosopumilaceae archaeon]